MASVPGSGILPFCVTVLTTTFRLSIPQLSSVPPCQPAPARRSLLEEGQKTPDNAHPTLVRLDATYLGARQVEARRSVINEAMQKSYLKRLSQVLIHQSYLYSSHGRIDEALAAADRIFINTGTRPRVVPIPGLDSVACLTNRNVMDLTELPELQGLSADHGQLTDDCLAHLDELADTHRNCDFYWYPRRDEVKLRTLNPPDIEPPSLPYARCIKDEVGFSHEIITRERKLKFEELEYLVPAQAGPACFQEVRRRILDHHRQHVAWRVLYRFVAADDAYLSPAHDRDSVAISVHQNASLPYQDYFDDIEPILRSHGGRPHWAKRHSLHGEALAQLYPRWSDFMQLRRRLDPHNVLLSEHLADLLGEERSAC